MAVVHKVSAGLEVLVVQVHLDSVVAARMAQANRMRVVAHMVGCQVRLHIDLVGQVLSFVLDHRVRERQGYRLAGMSLAVLDLYILLLLDL